ncbi:PREDICTED: deoxyribonuclease-1 isoform X4 [Cercocebus atys]|nr:PREDICTED: deoxyribonuclease-1 isoform X4 [Cercocebus atys]XP_011885699.1 PREDICTED: deoxyribonuclease-1 isoform X4 [Cercocebus atys]
MCVPVEHLFNLESDRTLPPSLPRFSSTFIVIACSVTATTQHGREREDTLQSKQQKEKIDIKGYSRFLIAFSSSLRTSPSSQDEGHEAAGGSAGTVGPTAGGRVPEDRSLQHPDIWGDQDVQCHPRQLHCTAMHQTPITMWSVSHWDGTAIRSATCSCTGLTRCLWWTATTTMTAASPVGTTPSAESQPSSGSPAHSQDVMLMGDFNAGCSYVRPSQWSSIRLRMSPTFQWLIPDTADTTATSTHCAYDRIVVAGTLLQDAVVPDSALPFNFQAAYGLSDQLVCVLPCTVTWGWDTGT